MDWLMIVGQILLAGLGTLFFGISLSVSRRDLPYVAIVGAICFSTRIFFADTFHSYTLGTFMAALIVAFLAIFLAKQRNKPMAVFLASGIVPILPGYAIFKMVLGLVEQNNVTVLTYGSQALQALIIIAVAIVVASSVSKMIDYVINEKLL